MKIKRYFAADMRQAIRMVREEQGPDAVILSNRRVDGGVEIVAAVDYDEAAVRKMATSAESAVPPAAVAPAPRPSGLRSVPRPEPADLPDPYARSRRAPEPLPEPMLPEEEPELPAFEELPPRRQSEPRIEWSQDPSLVAMRDEIKVLRAMLENQLSTLAWRETQRSHPLQARLLKRLMQMGLSNKLCRELAERVRYTDDAEHNWRQALGLLARQLPVTNDDILSHGGMVAVVGPTGVGKTTTVAKLAARYTLRHGPGRVALVTTDSYRIGAHQQLLTFGRILGVPVHVANDGEELQRTLMRLRDKPLVLIDTAGMSQRDLRLSEQFSLLQASSLQVRTYVVLSTTTQRSALDETVRAFRGIDLDGCILTKVDETAGLGESLSVVAHHQLPVAYVSDGQRVPEDLHPARANNLVTRSVALMQKNAEVPADEALALAFGQMVSNAHV